MNEKLFITTVDGERLTVLPLNGSATLFPKPWETLSHLFNILDLPVYQGGHVQLLNINPRYINEILGIEHPTPEDEAKLTAVLLSKNTAISEEPVEARTVKFNLGQTPMTATLVDASRIRQIPTRRLLIITDLPRN